MRRGVVPKFFTVALGFLFLWLRFSIADPSLASELPRLVGTIIQPPFKAVAILEEPQSGKQEVVEEGETAFSHFQISSIRANQVMAHSGKESFQLHLGGGASVALASVKILENFLGDLAEANAKNPRSVISDISMKNGFPVLKLNTKALMDQGWNDYDKDLEESGNNSKHGIKLSNIKLGSILNKIGLKSGDTIKEINGTPVLDKGLASKLIRTNSGKALGLSILREGHEIRFILLATD